MSQDETGFLDDLDEEEDDNDEIVVESTESESQSEPQTHDQENTLLRPVDDVDEVVDVYKTFEEMKESLLDTSDKTEISGSIHVNKSGWRKFATAFNLSVDVVSTQLWVDDGIVKARAKARATAPNGKQSTDVSMCASNEAAHMNKVGDDRNDKPELDDVDADDIIWVDGAWRQIKNPREVNEHNILATAVTRAKNRAISDCVGGGEVSAEEIKAEDVL